MVAGILSGLLFGFWGTAWFAVHEFFEPGNDRGVFMALAFAAGLSFVISAIWAVVLLMWTSLLHEHEVRAFGNALGFFKEMPTIMFMLGVVLTTVGVIYWYRRLLDDPAEVSSLVVALSYLGINVVVVLCGCAFGVQCLYQTRLDTKQHSTTLSWTDLGNHLLSYCNQERDASEFGFIAFLRGAYQTESLAQLSIHRAHRLYQATMIEAIGLDVEAALKQLGVAVKVDVALQSLE